MPHSPAPGRPLAYSTALATLALLVLGCSGGHKSAPTSADPDERIPSADLRGSTVPVGAFDLAVSASGATLELLPLREAAAYGDSFEAEVTSYLTRTPCYDCLKVTGFGLTPDFDAWVDISMRHPYGPFSTSIEWLTAYDARVILIPQLDILGTPLPKFNYIDSPEVSGTKGVPAGIWDVVRNADGYTNHFDRVSSLTNPAADPDYNGNLNPFKWYYREDDPLPEFEGGQIPFHRFRPGDGAGDLGAHDGPDTKRWLIDLTDPDQGGTVVRRFTAIIEVSWGQATTQANNRTDYLERLPEFNIKEAYAIRHTLPQTIFDNTTNGTLLACSVEVEDWQNSTLSGTAANQVNCPSDVLSVSIDMVGDPNQVGFERLLPYIANSSPASGTGIAGDPYIFTFAVPTLPAPDMANLVRNDPYLCLIRVEDEYNQDLLWDPLCAGLNTGPDADGRTRANGPRGRANNKIAAGTDQTGLIDDFVAYRIVPIFVRPAGPPTINLYPPIVDQGRGLAHLSGQILGLDASTLGLASAQKRLVTTITQIGPGGAPMNTPWTLPLQCDEYGRYQISMPLLPGGNNNFTVTANNQYPAFATTNAAYAPINWNPDPLITPAFRISTAWEPMVYNQNDYVDLDLHVWEPIDPGPSTYKHKYYCNFTPNFPGTAGKPCGTSDFTTLTNFILKDDNGFGPECIDGLPIAALLPNREFAIGVNYFTHRKGAGVLTHAVRTTTRIATYGVIPNLQIFTDTTTLNRENFNTSLEFYIGQDPGFTGDYAKSWYRPADLTTDPARNPSIGPVAISFVNLNK